MKTGDLKANAHKGLAILTMGHFINDIHAAFLVTFTPILMMKLGLSITQASMLTFLSGIINSFLQPLLGYASDQTSRPLMILVGPILTALGASLIPSSPSYALAFLRRIVGHRKRYLSSSRSGIGRTCIILEKSVLFLFHFFDGRNIGERLEPPLRCLSLPKVGRSLHAHSDLPSGLALCSIGL